MSLAAMHSALRAPGRDMPLFDQRYAFKCACFGGCPGGVRCLRVGLSCGSLWPSGSCSAHRPTIVATLRKAHHGHPDSLSGSSLGQREEIRIRPVAGSYRQEPAQQRGPRGQLRLGLARHHPLRRDRHATTSISDRPTAPASTARGCTRTPPFPSCRPPRFTIWMFELIVTPAQAGSAGATQERRPSTMSTLVGTGRGPEAVLPRLGIGPARHRLAVHASLSVGTRTPSPPAAPRPCSNRARCPLTPSTRPIVSSAACASSARSAMPSSG